MKIAIWKTRHEIADMVAQAVMKGLPNATLHKTGEAIPDCDIQICYGILRGGAEIYRWSKQNNTPFINIDRGYWKPGHYDGYYRISLNGTQQTTGLDKLEPDYERWDRLGLEILPKKIYGGQKSTAMICPPTYEVNEFYDYPVMPTLWPNVLTYMREKDCPTPLDDDLRYFKKVITFNSSVGWEALRQGIPVISDPNHSFLGAYMKTVDSMSHMTIDSRRSCFAVQAGLQLTLDEIRKGLLWPLMNRLISSSAMTPEKPLLPMSQLQA